jgi:eukaryotic-like serine/threonine-protein kinase
MERCCTSSGKPRSSGWSVGRIEWGLRPLTSGWADFKRWDEAWENIRDLPGGGQGTAKQVRSRANGQAAFLKLLNKHGDSERRARFFREATAYDTFSHWGIPRLVQSNSHLHANASYRPYIVTEYIDGVTLSQFIEQRGSQLLADATTFMDKLLEIVEHLHRNDWVHRDIKPDNIILQGSALDHPVLVDFGLSFRDEPDSNSQTEHGQEIGNRFLRLPELSSGSSSKRDPRSDVAFLGGILFYVLTKTPGFTVLDSDGRMPHQRVEPAAKLKTAAGNTFLGLQNFFNKCFSQKLSGRFSSASEMRSQLKQTIAARPPRRELTAEEQLSELVGKLNSDANRNLVRLKALYDRAMAAIREVHSAIARRLLPTYVTYQTGYLDFTGGLKNVLGFTHFATHSHRFAPEFLISVIGEEIVIRVDGAIFYRTDADAPEFDQRFRNQLSDLFLEGVRRLIESPLPQS